VTLQALRSCIKGIFINSIKKMKNTSFDKRNVD